MNTDNRDRYIRTLEKDFPDVKLKEAKVFIDDFMSLAMLAVENYIEKEAKNGKKL